MKNRTLPLTMAVTTIALAIAPIAAASPKPKLFG
jgi:hypothetical protein